MLSLGVGLQELASKRLSNSGLFDTVLVSSRSNLRGLGRNGAANSPPPQGARVLDKNARKGMEGLPNVVEVYPQIRFLTEMRYAGTPYSTIVAGIPVSARGNGAFEGIQGTFFRGSRGDAASLQVGLARGKSWQAATQ